MYKAVLHDQKESVQDFVAVKTLKGYVNCIATSIVMCDTQQLLFHRDL